MIPEKKAKGLVSVFVILALLGALGVPAPAAWAAEEDSLTGYQRLVVQSAIADYLAWFFQPDKPEVLGSGQMGQTTPNSAGQFFVCGWVDVGYSRNWRLAFVGVFRVFSDSFEVTGLGTTPEKEETVRAICRRHGLVLGE